MSKSNMRAQNNRPNMKQNQNNAANRSQNATTTAQTKPGNKPAATTTAAPASRTDNNTDLIIEMAKDATPREMMAWIEQLQSLYEQKKADVRKDLKDKVDDLMAANGYTIEELFGARQLPSTAALAQRNKSKANGKSQPGKLHA